MACSVQELFTIERSLSDGNESYTFSDQVYKIVVQWSDGTSTTIYRRYSMFFDFQVSNILHECATK